MKRVLSILLSILLIVPADAYSFRIKTAAAEEEISPFGIMAAFDPATLTTISATDKVVWAGEKFRDLGARWSRGVGEQIIWVLIEPEFGKGYDWSNSDKALKKAYENGGRNFNMVVVINPQRAKGGNPDIPSDKEDYYSKFVEELVERYDGDGINDYDSIIKVKYWQMANEPFPRQWENAGGTVDGYVRFAELTHDAIKKSDPDAKIILGTFQLEKTEEIDKLKEVIPKMKNKNLFDYVDTHYWNSGNNYKIPVGEARNVLDSNGYSNAKMVALESGTWAEMRGRGTEKDQANYLIKGYAYNIAYGFSLINWNNLVEWKSFGGDTRNIYNFMGLIADGENGDPIPAGTPRLSYYTYKKMTEKLEGSDWNTIEKVQETGGVYIYKFTKSGVPIWVAWNDNPVNTDIAISGINSSYVKITEAVPNKESGQTVDYNSDFNIQPSQVDDGTISITLGQTPVFIEETANALPVADDQPVILNENSSTYITLSATDYDGDPLTYSIGTQPAHGSLTGIEYDQTTYTPDADYVGNDSFTFKVYDGTNYSNIATVSIAVNPVSNPPILNSISINGVLVDGTTTINIDEGQGITITPSASDPDGDNLTYSYSGWMTSNTYTTNYNDAGIHTVTVTVSDGKDGNDSKTVTITVNDMAYALTITASNGATSKNPDKANYNPGETVTLTAAPNTGYSFSSWSGDLTGSVNPAAITMDGNKAITANFTLNTYAITATAGANGAISPSAAITVNHGANQSFTITADSGYHVSDVSVDGSSVGAVNNYTFDNVTSSHTITASFALDNRPPVPALTKGKAVEEGQLLEFTISAPPTSDGPIGGVVSSASSGWTAPNTYGSIIILDTPPTEAPQDETVIKTTKTDENNMVPDSSNSSKMSASEDNETALSDGTKITIPAGSLDSHYSLNLSIVAKDAIFNNLDKSGFYDLGVYRLATLDNTTYTLNRDAAIRIPYSDSDDDGYVDGTEIKEKDLKIYNYDEALSEWTELFNCVVNAQENYIEGKTNRLLLFGVGSKNNNDSSGA